MYGIRGRNGQPSPLLEMWECRPTGFPSRELLVTLLTLLTVATACLASGTTEESLLNEWLAAGTIRTTVQDFSDKADIIPELVVVSEADALRTAIKGILEMDDVLPSDLADYTPEVTFAMDNRQYSYDVWLRSSEGSSSMKPYYVEVNASFADTLLRYNVLSEDGSEIVSVKFYYGPDKDNKQIMERPYAEYWESNG